MLKQSRARAIEKKDISRKERKALNITKDTQRALLREIQHSFDDTNKDVVLFLIHEQEKKNQSIAIEMTGAERFYIEKVLSQIDGEAKNIVIVSDILNMNVENLVDFSSSMIFIERSENGKVVELSLLDNIKKSEIILVNVAASNDPLMSPDILEKHLEKIKENCPNFKRIIINFDEDGICQQGWMDDFDKVIAKVFSKEMGQSIIKQLEETVHCLKEECEQKKEKCEFFKKFQRELEEATNNFELKKAANSIIEEEIAKLQEEILAEQEKLTMQLALEEKNKELDQLRFHEERAIDEEKRFIFNQKLAEEEERRLQAREGAQKEFERRQTIETFFKEDLQRLNAEKKDHSEKVQNTTQESSKSKNISLLQSLYDKKYWIGGGVSLSALVVLILYYNFYH